MRLSHKPEEFDDKYQKVKTSKGNSGLLSNMYKREGSNSIFKRKYLSHHCIVLLKRNIMKI